ncbi:MAG TPA: glycosyltransferase family 39 protein [Holophaga sp.]|nr:glycosyltransferase family 39 protein [Holophaga sp.]HPS66749.1 glycosyltransferase family 39 protein [Holophaga sp.]
MKCPGPLDERSKCLLIWVFLGIVPLFARSLWEPDEARYAEIPREMLATGDWLTPRLNQVLYFEKPPLQYWLSAGSMKLFGVSPVAAKLPLALASLILLASAWRLSRRLGVPEPSRGVFMTATSLLVFGCHQILTLDALFSALLVASLAAAVEAVTARVQGSRRRAAGWTTTAFAASALALLVKGLAAPVLLGGVLLGSLPWAWKAPGPRRAVLRFLADPLGWLVFAVIGAPWFVLMERIHPGHAQFFFIHEHLLRFATHLHQRQGVHNLVLDKFYFAAVLLVGLLPWLATSILGLRRTMAFLRGRGGPRSEQAPLHRWTVAAMMLGFAVPFLFFTLSGSKLYPYILPAVVPVLVLACAFEREGEAPASLRRTGWELAGLGAVFFLAGPFALKGPGGIGWSLALGATFLGLGLWAMRPGPVAGPGWRAALGAGLLALLPAAQQVVGPGKEVSRLVRQAPADAQWISCGNYFQGIAFHAGQRVTVVDSGGELAFGRDRLPAGERARWFPAAPLGQVAQGLRAEAPGRPVWALIAPQAWNRLSPGQQGAWRVVDRTRSARLARLE